MGQHGLPFVLSGVLILAGIQMIGIGLIGELQVRHYYTSNNRNPYTAGRLFRKRSPEEPSMLHEH